MLRGLTVSRANLQKDGFTLVQSTMIRYVESIFPVVRSIMESRVPSPKKSENETDPDWSEEKVTRDMGLIITLENEITFSNINNNEK
jgi:hypothetical protein